MSKKLTLALGLLVMAVSSAGCTLYFDDEGDDDDNSCPPGYTLQYDEYGPVCVGDGSYGCNSDYDCAAGCYCDPATGTCVEAGFCSSDADCPAPLVCDETRGSCDPDGTSGVCDSDDDCGYGQYCDETTGTCIPSTTCGPGADCGPGYECQNGVCVPIPCEDSSACAAGCYCDDNTGGCVESCICASDADAVNQGWGWCDEPRSTCMPGTDPTPTCDTLTTQQACDARADCHSVYRGINCTDPDGIPCTEGSSNCTCESFRWDRCEAD